MGDIFANNKRHDVGARRDRIRERLLWGPVGSIEAQDLIGPANYNDYRIAKILRACLREGEELHIEQLGPKRRLYGLDPERLRYAAQVIREYAVRQTR